MNARADDKNGSMTLPSDGVGALRVGPKILLPGEEGGPLSGLRFAVKDNFDVEGTRTGCGQPTWLEDASPAGKTAPAIEELVAAGATLVGKAHQDELAFSLSGTNIHYGTPRNPAAPDREPGGSSSGSAAAVASGMVEFAVGSDTGGSVRVPASYCGVIGMRPTHGRIAVEGLAPLAPSFDTVGWFARSGAVMERVGRALLGESDEGTIGRIIVVEDALRVADGECIELFRDAVRQMGRRLDVPVGRADVAAEQGGLDTWVAAFRILQGREAWESLGDWITKREPELGPGIASRFEYGSTLTPEQGAAAEKVRAAASAHVAELIGDDAVLALPAASGIAPSLSLDREERDERRMRTLRLTSIAGLAGAPAISLPLCFPSGLPLGVCLVGAPGADERLLELARRLIG